MVYIFIIGTFFLTLGILSGILIWIVAHRSRIIGMIGLIRGNSTYKITVKDNLFQICFKQDTRDRYISVPYIATGRGIDAKVYVIYPNGREQDVTQPIGIPYALNPNAFGADKYRLKTQRRIKAFSNSYDLNRHLGLISSETQLL